MFESSNVAQDVLYTVSRSSRRRGRHEFAVFVGGSRRRGQLQPRGRERLILGRRVRRLQFHRQTTPSHQTRPVVGRRLDRTSGGRGRVLGDVDCAAGGGSIVLLLLFTTAAAQHDQEQESHPDGNVRNYRPVGLRPIRLKRTRLRFRRRHRNWATDGIRIRCTHSFHHFANRALRADGAV